MTLNANQIKAVSLLAQGELCKDVAVEVHVTPSTISEWKKNAEFEACLNSMKKEALEAARTQIQHMTKKATDVIHDVMKNGASDTIRLKAAAMVLAHAGMTDIQSGLYGWGIGGTTKEKVLTKKKQQEHTDSIIASLSL